MSDLRRIINVSFDVQECARKVLSNAALVSPDSKQQINLYYGTQNLFRATLYNGSATTAFNCPTGSAFLFGIDNVWTPDKTDLVVSADAQFNILADWDSINVSAGKICWRANLATAALKTALGQTSTTSANQMMHCNLWMLPPGEDYVLLASWDLYVGKIAVDPVTAVAIPGITHLTTEAAAAGYVPKWGDQARWRWKDGGWQYLFEEDSKWRSMAPKITDGQPGMAWGNPED